MKQRNYSTEAIILATKDYSEADRILVVYTKDFGKLSLIAKGVRKTTSKKRGHLEIFNYLKF
ncbi:MAG: DNA repair protein RecO, partial [Patescibacteria group bacterium]